MWQLFVSALFGLGAGLIASGFQGYLQRKERDEDRSERRRELKREKAVLLLQETSDLVMRYGEHQLHALRLLGAKDKHDGPPPPSNGKVASLLSVYFPECVPLLKEFDDEMFGIVEKYAGELRKNDAYKDPDAVRGIHLLLAHDSALRVGRFRDDLRAEMQAQIAALW